MEPEPKVGDIVHFEINTRDPERAKKFYSKAFGWKYKDSAMPGIEYYLIDGVTPGGAINPLAQDSKVKAPTVYFGTDDIDATLKKVRDGGGTADAKQPIPGQVPDRDPRRHLGQLRGAIRPMVPSGLPSGTDERRQPPERRARAAAIPRALPDTCR